MQDVQRLEALIGALGMLVVTTRQVADSISREVRGFDGWDGEARARFDAAAGSATDDLHAHADQLMATRWRLVEDLERARRRPAAP